MVRQFRVSRAIERFRVNKVLDPIFWPVENSSWAVLLNEAEVYFALRQKALIRLDPQLNFVRTGDRLEMNTRCVFFADEELRNLDSGSLGSCTLVL